MTERIKRMSIKSPKRSENHSSVVSFFYRRRFYFDLLKTCVIAMMGYMTGDASPRRYSRYS